MPDRVDSGIQPAVLDQSGCFGGLEAFRVEICFVVQATGFQGIDGILAVAGTDVADIDAFALKILDAVDGGIDSGNQVNRFRMDGNRSWRRMFRSSDGCRKH